jgi:hypothetical protein
MQFMFIGIYVYQDTYNAITLNVNQDNYTQNHLN